VKVSRLLARLLGNRRFRVVLVAAAMGVAGTGVANASLPGLGPVTMKISGHITDATTGAGIPGMCVRVGSSDQYASFGVTASATTRSDGTYVVTWTEPRGSTYYFAVDAFAYCGADGWWQETSYPDVVVLTAKPGQSTASGIDMQSVPGGRVVGRVTDDSTGTPVAGLTVQVFVGGYDATNATGTDGTFVVGGLPAGPAIVLLNPPHCYAPDSCFRSSYSYLSSFVPHLPATTDMRVVPTFPVTVGQTTTVDDTVLRSDTFSGRLTDRITGKPVRNVEIDVIGSSTWNVGDYPIWTTDVQGRYRVTGYGPGTYNICFRPRNEMGVSAHQSRCWRNKPYPANGPYGDPIHVYGFGIVRGGIDQKLRPIGVG
jgi:hypothetical protein